MFHYESCNELIKKCANTCDNDNLQLCLLSHITFLLVKYQKAAIYGLNMKLVGHWQNYFEGIALRKKNFYNWKSEIFETIFL